MKLLIVSILLIISLLHRVQAQQTIRFQGIQNNRTVFRKVNFQWANCGSSRDPFQVETLNISPNDIHFPEKMDLNFAAQLKKNESAPVHLFVTMKRKFGIIWLPIPCADFHGQKIGSCHYSDACDLSPFKNAPSCPSIFQDLHIPCKCPVTQGHYQINNYTIPIPKLPLPDFLVTGKYAVKAKAYDNNNHEIGCFQIKLTLK